MKYKESLAARMRNYITIQEEILTSDSIGGYSSSWADLVSLWAEIIPVKSQERFIASQLEHKITHQITTRYNSSIKSKHRVKFGARYFNIISAMNLEEGSIASRMMVEEIA